MTSLSEFLLPVIKSSHAILIINLTHQLAKVWIFSAVVDLGELVDSFFLEFVADTVHFVSATELLGGRECFEKVDVGGV